MDNTQIPQEPAGPKMDVRDQINNRPWSVTLLAAGVLIITVINLVRFGLSIRYWSFLSSRSGVAPIYLTLTGLIWSAVGLAVIWGLWKAKKWAPRLMEAYGLTYALYYWLDHLFLMDHPVSGASDTLRAILPINWQFSAGVTVIGLIFMAWTLGRTKVKSYFGTAGDEAGPKKTDDEDLG